MHPSSEGQKLLGSPESGVEEEQAGDAVRPRVNGQAHGRQKVFDHKKYFVTLKFRFTSSVDNLRVIPVC